MNPGEVVLIRFPFSDLTTAKVRPSLVISSSEYNTSGNDVIFASITSNTNRALPNDILIDSTDEEFEKTGLKRASAIKTGHIFTLEKTLAKRLLGNIPDNLLSEVRLSLKELLEIP